MSTTTIDLDVISGSAPTRGKGLFQRLSDTRMRRGEAAVRAYLARLSDRSLADLGFTPEHIVEIRKTGRIPASFWR